MKWSYLDVYWDALIVYKWYSNTYGCSWFKSAFPRRLQQRDVEVAEVLSRGTSQEAHLQQTVAQMGRERAGLEGQVWVGSGKQG